MRIRGLAALVLLTGCGQSATQPIAADTSSKPPEIGRYVIVHSPHNQRDTVLLDTATGKTWQQVVFTDLENEPTGWEPLARTDNLEEITALRNAYPPKKGKQSKVKSPEFDPSKPYTEADESNEAAANQDSN